MMEVNIHRHTHAQTGTYLKKTHIEIDTHTDTKARKGNAHMETHGQRKAQRQIYAHMNIHVHKQAYI
jgi:hypothetical protein